MTRVPERRRASDLYSRGTALVIEDGATDWQPKLDDDTGEPVLDDQGRPTFEEVALPPVTLWVAKLSDLEMDTAMRHAARAQAVNEAAKRDPASENWQSMRAAMGSLDRSTWIALLIEKAMLGRREMIEARLAGAEVPDPNTGEDKPSEWARNGYLEGLFEAWRDQLQAEFAVDPTHPEAMKVLSEIERFNKQVDEDLELELEVEKQIHESWTDDVLLDSVTELMIDSEGASAWADEYKIWIVALCARDCEGPDPDRQGKCLCRGGRANHTEYHFKGGVDEVRTTDGRVRELIYQTFNRVTVEPMEGKGLPAKPASSAQSASPAATAASSTSSPEA